MSNNMQAYKLRGKVDEAGNLAVTESVKMPPGDVEIIVLQKVSTVDRNELNENQSPSTKLKRKVLCRVEAFRDLFENTEPAPSDFDPDQARWEALKEKYNL
jgi:ABC-type Fe2+-enterobactin transport system substrate-binding protein